MMFIDTHVVVWLYAGELDRISPSAQQSLEEQDLLISPMVILELQYLRETGRLTVAAPVIVSTLKKSLNLQVCELSFNQIVLEALAQEWTRDPFDRIIVAHAAARNLPLLTKDDTILSHYKKAFWSTKHSSLPAIVKAGKKRRA